MQKKYQVSIKFIHFMALDKHAFCSVCNIFILEIYNWPLHFFPFFSFPCVDGFFSIFFAFQNHREVSEWHKQVCLTLMLHPHSLTLLSGSPSWNFGHTKKNLTFQMQTVKSSVKQHFHRLWTPGKIKEKDS